MGADVNEPAPDSLEPDLRHEDVAVVDVPEVRIVTETIATRDSQCSHTWSFLDPDSVTVPNVLYKKRITPQVTIECTERPG